MCVHEHVYHSQTAQSANKSISPKPESSKRPVGRLEMFTCNKIAQPADLNFEVKFLTKKQINTITDCGVICSLQKHNQN